jgi:lipoprotein-releasing system ATP-binding protein
MNVLLKAQNISKSYIKNSGNIEILKNIHLSVATGEIIALMGPSGSGKSTLLNILGTLDTDYSGTIRLDDINISSETDLACIRALKLGFVFQFHHLLPEFTVIENLHIPRLISGHLIDEEEIMGMLTYIGLEDRINHYPDEISGGERQRVAVIRALINKPLLVLADEPTGNLDRENSRLLLNLIYDLKCKFQQSFLIATHDNKVTEIADRILYLKDGKIKEGIQ